MNNRFVVITRPPHNEEITTQVAPVLGMPAYETKLFLRYPLPSILKFAGDETAAENVAASFRTAGLGTDIVPVEELLALPPPLSPKAVGLADSGVWFDFEDGRLEASPRALKLLVVLEYDLRWVTPIGYAFVHHLGSNVTESRQLAELLVVSDGSQARIRLIPERLDYSGLGELKKAGVLQNWHTLLGEIRRRAPALQIDEALTKTRPRDLTVDGKSIEVHLAQEPEPLRTVLGLYGEFYLALKEWQALKGKLPEQSPSGGSGDTVVRGSSSGPPQPTVSPSWAPADRVEETFRPGATLLPYGLWCVAAVVVGVVLLRASPATSEHKTLFTAASLALFVFGSLAFAAQLARFARGHVTLVPDLGLRLAKGRVVGWHEISSVEEAGVRFSFDQTPVRFLLDIVRAIADNLSHNAAMVLLQVAVIALIGILVLALGFISGVLVPVMILLSPWQHRVVIALKTGEHLTWRDLLGEGRFIRRVKQGIRESS